MSKLKKGVLGLVLGSLLTVSVVAAATQYLIRFSAVSAIDCNAWDFQSHVTVTNGDGCNLSVSTGNCQWIVGDDGACICPTTIHWRQGDCGGALDDTFDLEL